jgi:hypothetical protein
MLRTWVVKKFRVYANYHGSSATKIFPSLCYTEQRTRNIHSLYLHH